MKVCICDRCGRQFNSEPKDGEFVNRVIHIGDETFNLSEPEGNIYETYDICDSCYDSFRRWMKRWVIEDKRVNGK